MMPRLGSRQTPGCKVSDFPNVINLADYRKGDEGPQPGETLEFLKAYMQIRDPKQREAVVRLVGEILTKQDQ